MKPLTGLLSLLLIPFVILLFSCQKSLIPPDLVLPTTDTGINYYAVAVCDYDLNETTLTSNGWTKVFEDNFNGDLSQWNVLTEGNSSAELNCYLPANVAIQNGILQIMAKKEDVTDPSNQTQRVFNYTTGFIESKNTFSPDANTPKIRISSRMKLPNGLGMISYFSSTGDNWPTQGQINMVIADGNLPTYYANKYYYGDSLSQNLVLNSNGFISTSADLTACYHVYELEWSKTQLNFYLDGKLVEKKTSGGHISDLFGKKEHLRFYLTVLSQLQDIPNIKTGTLSVDWIKVFASR